MQQIPSTAETRAAEALRHLGDVVYSLQIAPALVLEYLSPSAAEIFGFAGDEGDVDLECLLGRIDPRDTDALLGAAHEPFGEVRTADIRMTARDGTVIFTSHRYRKVRRDDGSVVVHACARDTTAEQSKLAEHAELEAHYRLLADNATDIVCLTGPDRGISWVSPSITEAFGWEPKELLGRQLAEFVHPDDRITTEENRRRLYSGAMPGYPVRNYLMRVATKDGRYRWASGRATPIFSSAGELTGIVSGLRDVDELVGSRELAQSERAKLRRILDSMLDPHGLLRCVRDHTGHLVDFEVVDVNPAGCRFMHSDRDRLVGTRLTWLNPSIAGSNQFALLTEAFERDEPFAMDDVGMQLLPGDRERYLDVRGVRVDEWLSVVWHDNTDRHDVAEALAESSTLYHALAENATDVVAMGDAHGVLEWVSPSVTSMVGWQPADLVGREFISLIHPDDQAHVTSAHHDIDLGHPHRYEARMTTPDGDHRWFSFRVHPVLDDRGAVRGRVAGWRDIQAEMQARVALQESEQRLRHQATHDSLTGLGNRRGLLAEATAMVAEITRPDEYVGVLFVDVDRLKAINDHYGHAGGDEVLAAMGARFAARVRSVDVVSRFGGDEFVILLRGLHDVADAEAIASAIIDAAAPPVPFEAHRISSSVSVGIALAGVDDDPTVALRQADDAMYRAKAAGRNRWST